MGQDVILPDWAKSSRMADAFAGLNPLEDNLAEGIGRSLPVIGYRGKTWTLRYRGEKKYVLNPADGTNSSYIDVVILGSPKNKSRTYYKNFIQGQEEPPICSSMDGDTPDAGVAEKQHSNCAMCPRNKLVDNPDTGRKTRECRENKRLAVLLMPTQTAPMFGGTPLLEPTLLRVPADSLSSLAMLGEEMGKRRGFHHSSYVTRVTFDPNKAHPCMMFKPIQLLTNAEAPVVLEAAADPAVARIIGSDKPAATANGDVELLPPGTSPTGLLGGYSAPNGGSKPPLPQTDSGVLSAVKQVSVAEVDETLAFVKNSLSAVSDAGKPQESDAEMDARVAAVMAAALKAS